MAGFKPVGSRIGVGTQLETHTVGTVAIHNGDLVKFHTDGTILVAAGADETMIGVAVTPNDSSGDINVGADVQVDTTPGLLLVADSSDGAEPVKGITYDFTGGTGAQAVNVTVGAAGNLLCLESGYKGDASMGVYLLQESLWKV